MALGTSFNPQPPVLFFSLLNRLESATGDLSSFVYKRLVVYNIQTLIYSFFFPDSNGSLCAFGGSAIPKVRWFEELLRRDV